MKETAQLAIRCHGGKSGDPDGLLGSISITVEQLARCMYVAQPGGLISCRVPDNIYQIPMEEETTGCELAAYLIPSRETV